MAEILTESFCERCGTRYTFEAAASRRRAFGRIRTLSRGVKNFVANDDASFSDAMAAAREEDARGASLQQLDAFHRTFNFCMSCRQYTCQNCWNAGVGECLSCAPDLSLEVLPAPFTDLAPSGLGLATAEPNAAEAPSHFLVPAWPVADRRSIVEPAPEPAAGEAERIAASEVELTASELAAIERALSRHAHRYEPTVDAVPRSADNGAGTAPPEADRVPALSTPPSVETALAAGVPEPVAETPVATAPPARDATTASVPPAPVDGGRTETRRLLQRFRPGRDRRAAAAAPGPAVGPAAQVEPPAGARASTDGAPPELEATTPIPAASAPEPALEAPVTMVEPPEAVVATRETVEAPVAAPEPAEVISVATEAPEAMVAAPVPPVESPSQPAAIEPLPEATQAPGAPEPAPVPPVDVAVQPTWRMVAPDGTAEDEPEPALPAWATPARTSRRPADAMPAAAWAARVATARPVESPVWEASSRDILAAPAPGAAAPGIHSCVSCGLSLSANARFCRRCGSRQG